ncbi:lipid A deacylase LpxR family protein [Microbulbifer pacificus]|uniref:Lipid A deacylase LpxR family protein n=1 Tax=Microbulbifer pacificus TaxID=407164 RepID=A0AAU0N457_9GAMM|nr:lipid A deacylase LpxR family protein [Microbulbifer pacificus]WOX07048.1 lipid A deacylase LpxR family protein [Microbulbifer pacificus]
MGVCGLATFNNPAVAGNLSLQLENDSFDGASDADYTQGMRLAYTSDSPPQWATSLLPERYRGREIRAQYFLGQAIFTPYEVFETELLEYDRPYAGWLYLGAALHSVNLIPESQLATAERFEISAGIVGPSSGAEQAQKSLHRVIHTYEVNGWDNQLRDEPALMLSYARKWAHIRNVGDSGFNVEFFGTLGGNLGNVNTALASGVGVRFGRDLYSTVSVSALSPATSAPTSELSAGDGWYLFSDLQLRYVHWDIFLDGNTFKDSHSVEKEPTVGELRFGMVFSTGRLRWSLYHARRSQEFVDQYADVQFSAIGLTASF